MLGLDIAAEDLTDYTLGHALDEVSDFGASELFARLAFDIALEHDLLPLEAANSLDIIQEFNRLYPIPNSRAAAAILPRSLDS